MTPGASPPSQPIAAPAGLRRRFIALIYEALLLAAVLLAGALPMVMLTKNWDHAIARATLQVWLVLLCGIYYVWQWRATGQTLPMKTWRMRLTTDRGEPLDAKRALARYAAAYLSLATLGLGFVWALVDRDEKFLHDRIAGTRLVMTDAPLPPLPPLP